MRDMYGLSVRAPWAGLIRAGFKTAEIRTWSTRFRGTLLICQTATPRVHAYSDMAGACVAIATLGDVQPWGAEDVAFSLFTPPDDGQTYYTFWLDNIRPVVPFKVKGTPRLWGVSDKQREQAEEAAEEFDRLAVRDAAHGGFAFSRHGLMWDAMVMAALLGYTLNPNGRKAV